VLADIAQAQARLDRLAAKVPTAAPWEWDRAWRLDGQTFATWIRRHAATRTGRALLTLATQAVFATEPQDLSALWACHYIGAAGGLRALIRNPRGAQQDRNLAGAPPHTPHPAAAL